ncbi:hypothetical protein EG68_12612 [Paragonimus skrjabini miyazakii]|uniref:Uncharacterized protein n=1 Tax=Paragonimus skrjabini miyazakii TaxID=59628 RepID=A0A8S9YMP9_9TREM|nr:hypothetical protein EG68_12612 [Paragonimus skrjabini miyazakii]
MKVKPEKETVCIIKCSTIFACEKCSH